MNAITKMFYESYVTGSAWWFTASMEELPNGVHMVHLSECGNGSISVPFDQQADAESAFWRGVDNEYVFPR